MSNRTLAASFLGLGLAALLPASSIAAPGERDSRAAERDRVGHIVVFRNSVENVGQETKQRERRQGFEAKRVFRHALKGFSARLSEQQLERLRADSEVAFISPDRTVNASDAPLASGDSAPTGVRRIEAATSTTAQQASGVNVAVIDTGIDLDHPDLNVASGRNCVSSGTPPDDDNGHGTHVAGSIVAENDGAGVVGVAPGTRAYAVKVLDQRGSGTWSQIICGIDWATATRDDADPSNDIAVANMSLGGTGDPIESCATTTDAMHKAICTSTQKGVTYVVAAGNDAWDFDYAPMPDVPAAYPEVLTVTAVSDSDGLAGGSGGSPTCRTRESDDVHASFSNFAKTTTGQSHTIAAPGVCIRSTWPGGSYNTISGTSMAAPHVAGAVALCLNEGGASGPCAGLTPAEIIQRMRSDAEAHTLARPAYGFTGDPSHAVSKGYFGYLTWVGTSDPSEAPAEPAPTVKQYQPTGYSLASGSVYRNRGAVSRLYTDDGSRVEITAAKAAGTYVSEIRPYASITAEELSTLKKLTVDYNGNATGTSTALSLRIYNFATASWETVDGPRQGVTSDRSFTWSNSTSPTAYVSSSGDIVFSVRGTRSSSFRTRTDLVRFTIEY